MTGLREACQRVGVDILENHNVISIDTNSKGDKVTGVTTDKGIEISMTSPDCIIVFTTRQYMHRHS